MKTVDRVMFVFVRERQQRVDSRNATRNGQSGGAQLDEYVYEHWHELNTTAFRHSMMAQTITNHRCSLSHNGTPWPRAHLALESWI